jgi:predicted metalloprotease with PDZ domain
MVRAMKLYSALIYLLLLATKYSFANVYNAIDYKLTPILDKESPVLKVEMVVEGDLSDLVTINFPSFWAGVDYSSQIQNIRCTDPQKQNQVMQKGNQKHIIINPLRDNKLRISYEIHQKPNDTVDVHKAMVYQDLVHIVGHGLFALPDDLGGGDEINFSVSWHGLPKHWSTLSSHGIGNQLSFRCSHQSLDYAMYIAGDIRLHQISQSAKPVYLALHGKFNWPDESIIQDLSGVIENQRAFFDDHAFPYYAISLIEGDKSRIMGGTRLYNSFASYFHNSLDREDYYILFAHEHLHNWIGGKIKNQEEEALGYWWTEGFTEYYTRVLAWRSGGITLNEFINTLNYQLKEYYLSPVINENNERIKQDFWNNRDVERLPYTRGFTFAMYLNYLLKKHNPEISLDTLMLDFFKQYTGTKFNPRVFQEFVKSYLPQGINSEMDRFIKRGETIGLNELTKILPLEKRSPPEAKGKDIFQFKAKLTSQDQENILRFFGR